jgi:hypothetical protein
MFKKIKLIPMYVAILIPLESGKWMDLKYSKIPKHKLQFKDKSLIIEVNESASPLIHILEKEKLVTNLSLTLKLDQANLDELEMLKTDDYIFRVGLITSGSVTLNFFTRMAASEWLKQLFKKADHFKGVGGVHFCAVSLDKDYLTKSAYKMKDLKYFGLKIKTEFKSHISYGLSQSVYCEWPNALNTIGVWISVDGDGSKSKFKLKLDNLSLN